MPQKLALIKWIDDKSYTPGIPISWIKNFTYDDYLSEDYDPNESVVVEWRDTKTPPPEGWVCYDGLIIDISEKKKILERKLRMIDGVESPRCLPNDPIIKSDDNNKMEKKKEKHNNKRKHEETSPKLDKKQKIYLSEVDITPSIEKDKTPEKRSYKINKRLIVDSDSDDTLDEDIEENKLVQTDSKNDNKSEFNDNKIQDIKPKITLELLYEGQQKTNGMLEELLLQLKTKENSRTTNSAKPKSKKMKPVKTEDDGSEQSDTPEVREKEIKPGSGICVTEDVWKKAIKRDSYTAMGLTLLTAIFTREELAVSNLRGGSSKVPRKDGTKVVYKALNSTKLDALMYAVEKQFHSKFDAAKMGQAINNRLTSMRPENEKSACGLKEENA